MILSDVTLRELCEKQNLVTDLTPESIQPASIDVRLGGPIKYLDYQKCFAEQEFCLPSNYAETDFEEDENIKLYIPPHGFFLATTIETVNLPNDIAAYVEGRSSVGRMGLFIQNAGWIDPGFKGQITLELYNASETRIILTEGARIAQLVFAKLDRPCEKPYNGKYQNQKGTTGSKIYLDNERRKTNE